MKAKEIQRNSALLRFPAVQNKTSISRTKATQLEKMGLFPKRIALGNRLVVWRASEIEEFCENPAGYRVKGGDVNRNEGSK